MRKWIVAVLFCACAPNARADLVLPGTRPIRHDLVLEPWEPPPGTRIVAAPVRGLGGAHVVEPGEPFSFSSKYRTRLYVVAETEELPERFDEAWRASHLDAEIPVTEIASVPIGSPLDSVRTTLRVRALDGERFELEVVGTAKDYDGTQIACTLAALAAGALGIVYLRRRRRRAVQAG